MRADEARIRPETAALEALIRATVARTARARPASDALLFLGNRHHAFPAVLVQDPILEPVDKLVWMVIYQSAASGTASPRFPAYADIARLANIASTSTVARALAILRLTRWLAVRAGRRDGGRYTGNVYSLHDEPLPLADALHLDPGYMGFVTSTQAHHHARVRRVALAVAASLDAQIGQGQDVLAPESALERRLQALGAIDGEGRRYFSFSADVLAAFRAQGRADDHDQNSKAVIGHQNSKSPSGSSSNNKKTTTTTGPTKIEAAGAPEPLGELVFPAGLSANLRLLAERYLRQIPAPARQAVLDELAGRLRSGQQGARPVRDPIGYLHELCQRVNDGRFNPNLGEAVRQGREQRANEAARAAAAPTPARPASRRDGPSPVAELLRRLGHGQDGADR